MHRLNQAKDLSPLRLQLPWPLPWWRAGKAFIPFYRGSDRSRVEMAYKGQGRLVFASDGGYGWYGRGGGGFLIWIIHNANDSGYR